MKKNDGLKKFNIFFLIILVISLIFLAVIFLKPSQIGQEEMDMYLRVGNYTGINLNSSALYFGTAMASSTVSRDIFITNIKSENIIARLDAYGSLAPWTHFSQNRIVLLGNESKNVTVSVSIPENAKNGDYSGKVRIVFEK